MEKRFLQLETIALSTRSNEQDEPMPLDPADVLTLVAALRELEQVRIRLHSLQASVEHLQSESIRAFVVQELKDIASDAACP